jgi:hypothetical protein
MYTNNINNDSDRRGSYMHTIRGKVAEQQDKKSSGTVVSADDWSIHTTHEQGHLYSESLFLSCP